MSRITEKSKQKLVAKVLLMQKSRISRLHIVCTFTGLQTNCNWLQCWINLIQVKFSVFISTITLSISLDEELSNVTILRQAPCKGKCDYWFETSTFPPGIWNPSQLPSHYFVLAIFFRLYTFYILTIQALPLFLLNVSHHSVLCQVKIPPVSNPFM